jgi:hypothetical protein
MRQGWSMAVVAVLVAVFAGGCAVGRRAGDDGSDAQEPATGRMLDVTDLRTFTLPLDPYRFTDANLPKNAKAEPVLIRQCMRGFGLDYEIPAAAAPTVVGAERRYGLADEEAAKVHGYHLPLTSQPDRTGPSAKAAQPSAEAMAVLRGEGQSSYGGQRVPDGGCVGQARRKLAEGAPKVHDERLGDELARQSYFRTREDSRVQRANLEWSACMKQAGYDYADPFKAVNDPQFESEVATPREIAVAVVDVRCKKTSNLINVMASVETAYQQRALTRNTRALEVIKENMAARERNAAAVLAAS